MARDPENEAIYKVAEQFRERCLERGQSLLWPNDNVWTVDNLVTLRESFMEHPLTDDRSFLGKLNEQIARCSDDVHKVAADVFALYFLPVWHERAGRDVKTRSVQDVISWKLSNDPPDLGLLEDAFANEGLLNPGVWYMTGRPWIIAYYLRFAEEMKRQGVKPDDSIACKKLADDVLKLIPMNASAGREIILHLIFPDQFENILTNDKEAIAEAFRKEALGATDVDDALFNIRQELERQRGRRISFYEDEIWALWHTGEDDALIEIAELLRNTPLDDPKILSIAGLRSIVWPVTREPFLDRVAESAALGTGEYSKGRDVKRKRGSLDRWDISVSGVDLFVAIGYADDRGELDQRLVWGASRWGKLESATATAAHLQNLDAPGFSFRQISGVNAVGFGGTSVALFKSQTPDELEANDLDSLISEIAADLQMLHGQLPGVSADHECPAFLVGADDTGGKAAGEILERIVAGQPAATWWSYPIADERKAVADTCPYLYLYASQPTSKVTHRLHFREYRTTPGNSGMVSPWPDFTLEEERGKTSFGATKNLLCKTWFLIDQVEALDPPLTIADVERLDGTAPKASDLLGGFGIWRRKKTVELPRRQDVETDVRSLADATNLDEVAVREMLDLLEEKPQLILEGPPGSGKTFIARLLARHLTHNPLDGSADNRITVVQFHQSYGYEDFVEGIRPDVTLDGEVTYAISDGIFKRICKLAAESPGDKFAIVIDEINRGNTSRVFGELLLLLEYRNDGLEVTLPYSHKQFGIPDNMYIIATMNTTDRSLALIDYALRRRFYFYQLLPVEKGRALVLERWLKKQAVPVAARDKVLRLFVDLNEKVQKELDEHHQVGHSYFMNPSVATEGGLKRIWDRAILPLLEEYFYSRPQRTELLEMFSLERLVVPSDTQPPVEVEDPSSDA